MGGFSSKHFSVILEEIHQASEVNIYFYLALGTALEVVEVDVLEDDAIFHLRPEGPSRQTISVVA